MNVLKMVSLVMTTGLAITVLVFDLIQWNKKTCKDSENYVIVRYKIRFIFRVILSCAILISLIMSLFLYVFLKKEDFCNMAYTIHVLLIMSYFHWKFYVTDKGIKNSSGYFLVWDKVDKCEWYDSSKDSLFIEHENGFFKLRLYENKQQVIDLLEAKNILINTDDLSQ